MGLSEFFRDKFMLKGQSSELGEHHYRVSLSYCGMYSLSLKNWIIPNGRRYNCSFDTWVWSHNHEEAVERAKEKWMVREKNYRNQSITGRVPVHKEGMFYDPD